MDLQDAQQHRWRPSERGTTRVRAPRQQPSHRKSRGLTCANCRIRKVRCDGSQPVCKMCELYNDDCRYDKPPPMSQLVAMAKRLQEAEQTVAELRAGTDRSSSEAIPSHIEAPSSTDSTLHQYPQSLSREACRTSFSHIPTSLDRVVTPRPATIDHSWDDGTSVSNQAGHSTLKETTAPELTVDEHGDIRYYGPTSAVHEPSPVNVPNRMERGLQSNDSPNADTRSSLAAHARESAIWEEFAIGNASLQTGIPRQVIAKLLHIHWTWVAPMFLWVHRPAFIRDMATGGRHYSDFLLTVICAHAGKYEKFSSADTLLTRARALLGTAIQQRSSIPTVQALLQLSALDLAQGSISQAWVYSGIAFRMATDLGLQHVSKKINGLSPVDLEVRRRLYWSCYFWDKATSLYTGRIPSVTEVLDQSSLDLLDDSADSDVWTPYFADSLNLTKLSHTQYPPTNGYVVACFVNSCKLSIIINDIITKLYYRRSKDVIETAFRDITNRLELWRAHSPPQVRYDPNNLPLICPPPHLISQNMLYFASVILTHRPFWSVPVYYQVCVQASESIEKLVLLLETTFGLDNITYLMGYCIYTGASVSLEDAKKNNNSAHPSLRTFLRALNSGMRRCRLLERSLNIIIKEMSHSFQDQTILEGRAEINEPAAATSGYIPAFPYIDPAGASGLDVDTYFDGIDLSSMHVLDSYPEMQMDLNGMFGDLV